MPQLDAEVLEVGRTRLAYPEPVPPEQDRQGGVVVIEGPCSKKEPP